MNTRVSCIWTLSKQAGVAVVCWLIMRESLVCAAHVQSDDPSVSVVSRIEGLKELESTVGMPARVTQIVLPGPRLEVRDVNPRTTTIVLRIDGVYPHGDEFRYDLTWFGTEPGEFNLCEFLRREDGSATDDLPPCLVTVNSVLPDQQFDLKRVTPDRGLHLGGYRTLWLLGSIVWIAGLVALVVTRNRKSLPIQLDASSTGRGRLQRIEELLQVATASNSLSTEQKATLDRLILEFWRDRLNLQDLAPEQALRTLKQDVHAGPLLLQLEKWLYDRPAATSAESLASQLAPLRSLVQQAVAEHPPSGGAA